MVISAIFDLFKKLSYFWQKYHAFDFLAGDFAFHTLFNQLTPKTENQ